MVLRVATGNVENAHRATELVVLCVATGNAENAPVRVAFGYAKYVG